MNLIYFLILNLFCGGAFLQTPPPSGQLDSVSFEAVLNAHNAVKNRGRLSRATLKAIRLVSSVDEHTTPMINERREVVSISGKALKRIRIYPDSLMTQYDVSDGQQGFRVFTGAGRKPETIHQLTEQELAATQFNVDSFGLVSILARLHDSASDAIYIGRTQREIKYKVTTEVGDIVIYADRGNFLITKIVIGNRVTEYARYRSINGLKLPFIQRVWTKDRLDYELWFEKITLNRRFRAGYFSRQALAQEVSRQDQTR